MHRLARTREGATATPPGRPTRRPERRWPGVGWMLAAAGVLAVLLLVVFVVPRLLYPPPPAARFAGVAQEKRIELETNRLKLQNDARATLLQALAGGVLLLGAYFTWRQLGVTREGQITDRYTKAVDQLGSDHLDVRVGGIYALERIARDSPTIGPPSRRS
jgi:ABC-type Fe3+ transport system permease subunit